MSFPKYPTYKPSGMEWLGEVPEHWDNLPLKRLGKLKGGAGFPHDEQGRVGEELPYFKVNALGQADSNNCLVLGEDSVSREVAEKLGAYVFPAKSLVLAKVGAALLLGRIRVLPCDACIDNNMLGIVPDNTASNAAFLRYGMSMVRFDLIANPGAVPSLNASELGDFRLPTPSLDEQTVIAAFLDRETAKIDGLVAEQRRLIELLKEKRQAVISHAVTKGLNPNAPTKPSGIDWLGDVPEHWEIGSMKRYCDEVTDGAHVSPETENGVYSFVSTRDVGDDRIDFEGCLKTSANSFEFLVRNGCRPQVGDVLFSKDGTIGRTVVVVVDRDFVVASSLIIIRTLAGLLESQFLHWLCQSLLVVEQVDMYVKGAGLPRLSIQNLRKVLVCVPPVGEQAEIAAHVRMMCDHFNALTAEAEQAIALLQERRTSLISAAVTGKIDVRATVSAPLAKPFTSGFARQLLAAEILDHCYQHPTTGRVKLQKLIHLCEHVAEIGEISATYERRAAGPFDQKVMFGIAAGLAKQHWFEETKQNGRTFYRRPENFKDHKPYLRRWADKLPSVHKILSLLGEATTQQCEIVSTLYAAWNDLLIEGKSPTDAEIIDEASSPDRWHENKANVPTQKWPSALKWMRAHSIVPRGFGRHTNLPDK